MTEQAGEAGREGLKVVRKVWELLGEVGLKHPPFPEPLHGQAKDRFLCHLPQSTVAYVDGGSLDLEGFGPAISLHFWDRHGYLISREGKSFQGHNSPNKANL